MIPLSGIIRQFKDKYFSRYKNSILPGHRKALAVMERCRQSHGPHMLAQCECGRQTHIPHSCGHRSCPHCQNHENDQWISNQLNKRLPARYFLITFTLPAQFRHLAGSHQRLVYSLMFSCVQQTLKTFAANDKHLGGAAGFTTVLHTHARTLDYHPHIHVVMPAATINLKTGLWRVKDTGYLFSHKALARVFRAKLLQAMVERGLRVPKTCPRDWVVDCRDVGNGDKAIIYLGRYLYRGVIREEDILKNEDGMITFRYCHAKTGRYRTRTLPGEDFLYLLMQHVLPRGFRRSRSYGFLHPCSKKLIRFLQLVLRVIPAGKFKSYRKQRPGIICPACGKIMEIVQVMIPGHLSRSPVLNQ
jgi:hypothetical protein